MRFALMVVVVVIAFYIDISRRRIPNALLLPSIVVAALLWYCESGFQGLLSWSLGLAAGLVLLFIPFALGGIGAGDVKLLGSVGALMGAGFALDAALWGGVVGGAMSLFAIVRRGQTHLIVSRVLLALSSLTAAAANQSAGASIRSAEADVSSAGVSIAYGAAIAIGSLLASAIPIVGA